MGVLRSRLLADKLAKEHAEMDDARRSQVGTGDRSERFEPITFRKTV